MKNNWKDIDELNDALGQPLDLDAAWADFDNKKSKRRVMWPFFMGGLLILASLSLLVFQNFNTANVQSENHAESDLESAVKKNIRNDLGIDIIRTAGTKEFVKDNESILANHSNREDAKNEQAKREQTIREQKLSPESVAPSRITNLKEQTTSQSIRRAKNNLTISTEINEAELRLGMPVKDVFVGSSKGSEQPSQNEALAMQGESFTQMPLTALASLKNYLNYDREKIATPLLEKIDYRITDSKKAQRRWSLGLQYSISKVDKKWGGDFDALATRRIAKEVVLENNSLELTVSRRIGERFAVYSGILLDQTRTKTDETIIVFEWEELEGQVKSINYRDGQEVSRQTGSIFVLVSSDTRYVRYNSYRNLWLPIGLSYDVFNISSWNVKISAGVNFQLLGKVKGETFESEIPDGQYRSLSNLDYRTSGVKQGSLALTTTRNLSRSTKLNLGLCYVRDFNNRRAADVLLKEQFSQLGVSVGIRREF